MDMTQSSTYGTKQIGVQGESNQTNIADNRGSKAAAIEKMRQLHELIQVREKWRGVRTAGIEGMGGELAEMEAELRDGPLRPPSPPVENDGPEASYKAACIPMQVIREKLIEWTEQEEPPILTKLG